MDAAYNNRVIGYKETSVGPDFDQASVTAEDLQLARTKEAILQKLQVIFGPRDECNIRSGGSGAISTRTLKNLDS